MNHRILRSLASTALAAGLLAGCASTAPHPGQSASRAQSALDGGQTSKAVALAEQAALADPRNPGYRMLLGSAYMRDGRFESARQAYDDAMELGEDGGKAALSLALTDIALGHGDIAIDTLNAHQAQIPVADYGLALALAGHAPQAVAVLEQALRTSEPSPKLRQNYAYALAMSGQWREAREMAAQDVPADQLTQRMAEWAQLNDPANMRLRVAGVLGVPMRVDQGQPTALALANFPATAGQAVAAAAEPQAPAAVPSAQAPALASFAAQELPALDNGAAQPQVADASSAPAAEKLAVLDMPPSRQAAPALAPRADQPLTASTPWARPAVPAPLLSRHTKPAKGPALLAAAAQARAAKQHADALTELPAGSHVVQLGAFSTEEGARRAWRHYLARNPALKGYHPVITAAVVKGRQFWRTQAAGFASADPARSLCGSVKANGGVCIVLANPLNGPAAAPAVRYASNRR